MADSSMFDINRKHKRFEKPLVMKFCIANVLPKKWDMTIIENMSAGGIRFIAPSDLELLDQIIQIQIRVPEIAPVILDLEAIVLSVKPRLNSKNSDIRAKFINLSETNKGHLSVVENMINTQENKKSSKIKWKANE